MSKKFQMIFAFALGLVLVSTACGSQSPGNKTPTSAATSSAATPTPSANRTPTAAASPTTTAQAKYGGTMRVRVQGELQGYDIYTNPLATTGALDFLNGIYEGLIGYKEPFDTKAGAVLDPRLATSWQFAQNGTHLILKLRPDVKWHDGTPFTSADVVATFMRIKDPKHDTSVRIATSFRQLYDNVVAVDPLTVRIEMPAPSNQILTYLASPFVPILPKHILDRDGKMGWPPVGTGAWTGASADREKGTVWKRYTSYWAKDPQGNPLPYLDAVEQGITIDFAIALAALRTNAIDTWANWPVLRPRVAKPVAQELASKTQMIETTSFIYTAVSFNTKKAPFNDPIVRKAVRLAIDKHEIKDTIFDGAGIAGAVIDYRDFPDVALPKSELDKLPGLEPGKGADNIAKARKMLDAAGYPATIKLPNGMMANTNLTSDEMGSLVMEQLRKIGIQGEVTVPESAVQRAKQAAGDWELAVGPTAGVLVDPTAAITVLYTSYGNVSGAKSASGWFNEQLDKWWLDADRTTDPAVRKDLVRKMETFALTEDGPIVLMWLSGNVIKYNYVKNYFPGPTILGGRSFRAVWFDKA